MFPEQLSLIGFKWMGYGLNAYVSPDMKQASTLIEKTLFRNLGATVQCERVNGKQDAFIIQRSAITRMPIFCSLLAAS